MSFCAGGCAVKNGAANRRDGLTEPAKDRRHERPNQNTVRYLHAGGVAFRAGLLIEGLKIRNSPVRGLARYRTEYAGPPAGDFLDPETYSGVSLNIFPLDWHAYKAIEIGIYNPDQTIISMTCRIHDRIHVQGPQRFQDRFNRRYTVLPGWNRIHIPLHDVQQAPEGRALDLSAVMAVGLFATRLDHHRPVFLDDLRLLN